MGESGHPWAAARPAAAPGGPGLRSSHGPGHPPGAYPGTPEGAGCGMGRIVKGQGTGLGGRKFLEAKQLNKWTGCEEHGNLKLMSPVVGINTCMDAAIHIYSHLFVRTRTFFHSLIPFIYFWGNSASRCVLSKGGGIIRNFITKKYTHG